MNFKYVVFTFSNVFLKSKNKHSKVCTKFCAKLFVCINVKSVHNTHDFNVDTRIGQIHSTLSGLQSSISSNIKFQHIPQLKDMQFCRFGAFTSRIHEFLFSKQISIKSTITLGSQCIKLGLPTSQNTVKPSQVLEFTKKIFTMLEHDLKALQNDRLIA